MEPLLSWQQLADLVAQMPEHERALPVLLQNRTTGAYFGVTGIRRTEDDESMDVPPQTPVLNDDYNWFYYLNGEPSRNRYAPYRDEVGTPIGHYRLP